MPTTKKCPNCLGSGIEIEIDDDDIPLEGECTICQGSGRTEDVGVDEDMDDDSADQRSPFEDTEFDEESGIEQTEEE